MAINNLITQDRAQQVHLFQQAQHGCRASLNRLMAQHEGLVQVSVRRQWPGQVPFAERVQAGRIGLWRAILRYQPERGLAFSTYAWPSISRAVWRVVQEAEAPPAVGLPLVDPPATTDPALGYERQAVVHALSQLVARLPEKLGRVITAYYGLNDTPPALFWQIGASLGVSDERARQLHREALLWLGQPGHSDSLRTLLGRHRRADYDLAQQQAHAWRQYRRRRSSRRRGHGR